MPTVFNSGSHQHQKLSGPVQACNGIALSNGASVSGGKKRGHKADHSTPYNSKINNKWRSTFISPYVFMACKWAPFNLILHFMLILLPCTKLTKRFCNGGKVCLLVQVNVSLQIGRAINQAVVDLSPWRPDFHSRSVNVRFVLDKAEPGQVCLRILRLSPVNTPQFPAHFHLQGRRCVACEPYKKQCSFGNRRASDRKVLSLSVFKGLNVPGALYISPNKIVSRCKF